MKLSAKEFEYQFRCLYRPLNMYALRYTENLDDAEDIVQQAFSDVWEKLVGGTSIQNLKAYMYQTVRNRSLTLVTNRQTHCETTELTDLEDLTEEERIIRSERDARLWTAIDHLPTERKKIFLLSKRDGLTYQEIATELGISIKTVEHQISKALKTLRETAIIFVIRKRLSSVNSAFSSSLLIGLIISSIFLVIVVLSVTVYIQYPLRIQPTVQVFSTYRKSARE